MSLLDADVKYNKDGKPDGRWRAWFDNGSICTESNYKDGVKDGLFIWWYENGQKKLQECYKDDEIVGITTMWHENGQKKSEVNFDNGIKDRVYIWFDKNGKKEERGTYKDGELILKECWDSEGNKECWDSAGKKIECKDGVENSTLIKEPISNELKNALSTMDTREEIMNAIDWGSRNDAANECATGGSNCSVMQGNIDKEFERISKSADNVRDRIASEEQKLEEANK